MKGSWPRASSYQSRAGGEASIAGTPEEVTSKIKAEIEGTGVNHYIAAITDASLVKAFTGQTVEGVATVDEQLRLLAEEVAPNFR